MRRGDCWITKQHGSILPAIFEGVSQEVLSSAHICKHVFFVVEYRNTTEMVGAGGGSTIYLSIYVYIYIIYTYMNTYTYIYMNTKTPTSYQHRREKKPCWSVERSWPLGGLRHRPLQERRLEGRAGGCRLGFFLGLGFRV